MVTKQYISKSHISVNVVLGSGKSVHVSFVAKSNGTSTFTTDNAEIQQALERHYRYGRMFRLAQERTRPARAAQKKPTVRESKEVTVSDRDEAKTYLADHFSISRTKLRTLRDITTAAAKNGVVFVGLE